MYSKLLKGFKAFAKIRGTKEIRIGAVTGSTVAIVLRPGSIMLGCIRPRGLVKVEAFFVTVITTLRN